MIEAVAVGDHRAEPAGLLVTGAAVAGLVLESQGLVGQGHAFVIVDVALDCPPLEQHDLNGGRRCALYDPDVLDDAGGIIRMCNFWGLFALRYIFPISHFCLSFGFFLIDDCGIFNAENFHTSLGGFAKLSV